MIDCGTIPDQHCWHRYMAETGQERTAKEIAVNVCNSALGSIRNLQDSSGEITFRLPVGCLRCGTWRIMRNVFHKRRLGRYPRRFLHPLQIRTRRCGWKK